MPPPVQNASSFAASRTDSTQFGTSTTDTQTQTARPTTKAAKSLAQRFGSFISRIIPKAADPTSQQTRTTQSAQSNPYAQLSAEGQQFLQAAVSGDLELLNSLMQQDPQLINTKIGEDQTIQNADGSVSGSNSSTLGKDALREAAKNGHSQIVIALAFAKVDSAAFDNLALRLALSNGHAETAATLIEIQTDTSINQRQEAIKLATDTLDSMQKDQTPDNQKGLANARAIVEDFSSAIVKHHSLEESWVKWIQTDATESEQGPDFSEMFSWLPPEQREEELVNFILHYSNPDNQVDPAVLSRSGSQPDPEPSPAPASISIGIGITPTLNTTSKDACWRPCCF